jgi:hypothetical protein
MGKLGIRVFRILMSIVLLLLDICKKYLESIIFE